MKTGIIVLLVCLAASAPLLGDAGVLIPTENPQPDPKILSLAEMDIDVLIDNSVARVSIRQIFASHVSRVLEGNWVFALPARATVSDFAVWDDVTRIPGVILERRRAEEIYERITQTAVDPGLLQMGEHSAQEARRTAVFSARVAPIPGYGYKRIEIEYHERLPVENLQSHFAIPLRPDAYQIQTADKLTIRFEVRSKHPIRDFRVVSDSYPLPLGVAGNGPPDQVRERLAAMAQERRHRLQAVYRGTQVNLSEDFAVEYTLDAAAGDALEVLTYRDPTPGTPNPTTMSPEPAGPEPGFFEASALVTAAGSAPRTSLVGPPAPPSDASRTVIILFDNSLSMQWEKLDRSYQALETLLRRLRPQDRFDLLLFNSEVRAFEPQPVGAELETVERALDFVKSSRIRGGTNLQEAFEKALALAASGGPETYLVLLSDGGPSRGTIHNGRLAEWYHSRLAAFPAAQRPRTYAFAIGDDANLPFVRLLEREGGIVEWVRSTEPIEFKLNAFLSKIGRRPLQGLQLSVTPQPVFDLMYPLEKNWFAGSVAGWVGRYLQPATEATFGVAGSRRGEAFELDKKILLPKESLEHAHLPRTWARARVDALLEKIERDGEDQATIDEIIRLARKYKFVTPYTSFLAAPRSLLRPRAIRPGDPLLRVRTDESIVSVTALFPFGLVKKLKYLPSEDIWQTRFLAPKTMSDGEYHVRLLLRDRQGRTYREQKSFVIASKPPVVRVHLDKKSYRRGEVVKLQVAASKTTRTLVARMYGAEPVNLRWNPQAKYNTGDLFIPEYLPAGSYSLTVTAEDFAHNIGSEEVTLDVLP